MSAFEQIVKIKALAVTAKTAIYNEEAMTALELAGVTACKVNQCVDAINLLVEAIELLENDIQHVTNVVEYIAEREELII